LSWPAGSLNKLQRGIQSYHRYFFKIYTFARKGTDFLV
jgi:hypothetical protein